MLWDSAADLAAGSSRLDVPESRQNHPPTHSSTRGERVLAQADPDGLPPVGPSPRSPSSRGATPEISHNTVLHVTPAVLPADGPSVEASAVASPSHVSSEQFYLAGLQITGAMGETAPEEDDSLESFKQALDTAEEELVLFRNVGRRYIDVIRHREYEYRRDRAAVRNQYDQRWVCRYAQKFKCKGRLLIHVRDLEDFMTGAIIVDSCEHNHDPFRLNTFGAVNVVEVLTEESTPAGTSTEEESDATGAGSQANSTPHSLSRLSERDFATDFGGANIEARFKSSPVASRGDVSPDTSGAMAPQNTAETSWDMMANSRDEAGAYQAVRHVQRCKEENQSFGQAADSSGTQL